MGWSVWGFGHFVVVVGGVEEILHGEKGEGEVGRGVEVGGNVFKGSGVGLRVGVGRLGFGRTKIIK